MLCAAARARLWRIPHERCYQAPCAAPLPPLSPPPFLPLWGRLGGFLSPPWVLVVTPLVVWGRGELSLSSRSENLVLSCLVSECLCNSRPETRPKTAEACSLASCLGARRLAGGSQDRVACAVSVGLEPGAVSFKRTFKTRTTPGLDPDGTRQSTGPRGGGTCVWGSTSRTPPRHQSGRAQFSLCVGVV